MINFHKNHQHLVLTAALVFAGLSLFIAVLPAYEIQKTQPLPSMFDLNEREKRGLEIYVSENCMACHTQQVRNIEMDKIWGDRPSIASDYYFTKKRMDTWRQSPSLLGSERTGPDLTNIGLRQPGMEWHLLHLYNPRIVVKESIMPGFPWLFAEKYTSDLTEEDVVVPVPPGLVKDPDKKVVATSKALDLVAYLQSLIQPELPGTKEVDFIPSRDGNGKESGQNTRVSPDGESLYLQTCAACHQANGEGLPGAFPPLAGSTIVNDDNYEKLINIILLGYDARTEFGVMPGFQDQLTDEEIAAIANHERSSWGNSAPEITPENVKSIREFISQLTQ